VPELAGRISFQSGGYIRVGINRKNEQSGTGLWNKVNRVDNERPHTIALVAKSCHDSAEVSAPVRRYRTGHILQNDQRRGAFLARNPLHQVPKGPKGTTSFAFETNTVSSEREVLTWKRSPHERRFTRQFIDLNLAYVANNKFGRLTEIGPICPRLLFARIVREHASPSLAKAQAGHSTPSEKFIESETLIGHQLNL
jgi:hypothetical protein